MGRRQIIRTSTTLKTRTTTPAAATTTTTTTAKRTNSNGETGERRPHQFNHEHMSYILGVFLLVVVLVVILLVACCRHVGRLLCCVRIVRFAIAAFARLAMVVDFAVVCPLRQGCR